MGQFLAIIRGGPASGKTTIAKQMRNYEKKVAWLKVDNFKDFFAEDTSETRELVDGSAIATLVYLLEKGFSVVMEKIFLDPVDIPRAVEEANKRNIPVKVFQIRCSVTTLQERDRIRPGVKQGCRKPMGDEVIARIQNQLEKTFYGGAIELDTEKMSVEECIRRIETSFDL